MDIRVETSTVADGNMSPRWGDAESVAAHRAAFLARIGVMEPRLVLCSVPDPNGVAIVEVDETHGGQSIIADALITRVPVALGLLTADCLPVIMHDASQGSFAIAHCGWKSTDLRLPECLLAEFRMRGSHARDMRVHIGPSIRAASYIRPLTVLSQRDDPRWAPFLMRDGGMAHIDLHGYVRAQCIQNGVEPGHISAHPSDAFADHEYFSHRRACERGEAEGRMLTVVTR